MPCLQRKNNKGVNVMLPSTINLGTTGFFLDVTLDDVEEGFISSFHGQFRKKGDDTIYPRLYWQIVNVPVGIQRIGNISFALDVDGSTEPFTSLYDISRGVYREQVAKAMNVMPHDVSHSLLVLNGLNCDSAEPIDDNALSLAIKEIERTQNFNIGLTGYFTDTHNHDSQTFVSFLFKDGFQKLNYDGFVSRDAAMFFRPKVASL
jgi:hypothetical protein